MIRLLLGGSPCTHWSIAKTTNRETEPQGIGWELFKNYLIARERFKPDYFLYENNKSAAETIKGQIGKELGVPLQYINSSLVSAQNRQRFYCHNIPNVPQPEDRGILLKDVLESGVPCRGEKSYCIDANYYKGGNVTSWNKQSGMRFMVAEPFGDNAQGKAHCLDANYWKGVTPDHCLEKHIRTQVAERVNDDTSHSVYRVLNGLIEIKNKTYKTKLNDGLYKIRKLTILECKRLQTVPDDYIFPVSDTQAYKMLGNGWTVDVVAHILSHIPNIKNEDIEVLSMYDGMSCGHIALSKIGANIIKYYASEIDKYAIQTTQKNYPETIHIGDAFMVRESSAWTFAEDLALAI